MNFSERVRLMLLQTKLGIHCNLIYSSLQSAVLNNLAIFEMKDYSLLLRIIEILQSRRYDVKTMACAIFEEFESPRRIAEFAEICGPQDAIRVIRISSQVGFRSDSLASVCSDKLCSSLDQRTPQELIDVLEWMSKFGYSHTQLIDNIRDVILVIPMTDDELETIVRYIIKVRDGDIGPKEEFLQRLVKFRLATVD
jgi:hypothetical protein